MSSNRFTKLLLLALSAVFLTVVSLGNSTQAQVVNLDLTGIVIDVDGVDGLTPANAARYVEAVTRGQAFWNARVLGYSNTLPADVQDQLPGGLVIFISNQGIGGGVLGFAGVDATTIVNIVRGTIFNSRSVAVGTNAIFVLDNDFINESTDDEIADVAIHEFGHALGIGTLWDDNQLLAQIGPGPLQYIGANARRAFAIEAGVAGLARTGFVPIEQQGGPGTALSHWDDDSPTFNSIALDNRIELMTGFFIPNTERFISRTSLASLVDLHYVVRGFNEDELIQFPNVLASQLAPPLAPLTANQRLSGFNSNPFGANEALRSSSPAKQPRRTVNVYKKRRR